MMILDNINNSASFDVDMRSGNGKVFLKAYATSGMVANTPMMVQFSGSGYSASILAASNYAYVGVPEGSNSVASGCVGWVQIRGFVSGVQFGTGDLLGSQGHSVFWGAAALGASTSLYEGLEHQVGVLMEDTAAGTSSTTGDIFLVGMWATPRS
jgi:hypothetical protein